MSVHIAIPDDLAEQIDHVASDRTAFVSLPKTALTDYVGILSHEKIAQLNQALAAALEIPGV